LRKKIKKEVNDAESVLRGAFDLLKAKVQKQIKLLEKTGLKRNLTKEEEKIVKQLKKYIDDAERDMSDEIEGIEKHLK